MDCGSLLYHRGGRTGTWGGHRRLRRRIPATPGAWCLGYDGARRQSRRRNTRRRRYRRGVLRTISLALGHARRPMEGWLNRRIRRLRAGRRIVVDRGRLPSAIVGHTRLTVTISPMPIAARCNGCVIYVRSTSELVARDWSWVNDRPRRRLRHSTPRRIRIVSSRITRPVSLDARSSSAREAARGRSVAIVINPNPRRTVDGARLPVVAVGCPLARTIDRTRPSRRRAPWLPTGIVSHAAVWKVWIPPIAMLIAPVMVPIAVDPDHPGAPIAIVGKPPAHAKSDAKGDPRIRPVINRLIDIHDLGLVTRNVDHVRLGRDDSDVSSIFDHDVLLRRIDEDAVGSRVLTIALNRRHHLGGLIGIRRTQLLRPREVFVHPFDHVRIVSERLDAIVPGLRIDLVGTVLGVEKPCGKHHVRTRGSSRQKDGHECVRIERDGRN